MPKNATQKLQKIQNDIKTVISIYEVAKKANDKNDKLKNQKESEKLQLFRDSSPRCRKINQFIENRFGSPSQQSKFSFDLFDDNDILASPKSYDNEFVLIKKKRCTLKKPKSAPSSSTLSVIRESDFQQPSDSENWNSENKYTSRRKPSDNWNISDWIASNDFLTNCDMFMTPSKTIQTANLILGQSSYTIKEKNESKDDTPDECVSHSSENKADCLNDGAQAHSYGLNAKSDDITNIVSGINKIKFHELEYYNVFPERSSSVFPERSVSRGFLKQLPRGNSKKMLKIENQKLANQDYKKKAKLSDDGRPLSEKRKKCLSASKIEDSSMANKINESQIKNNLGSLKVQVSAITPVAKRLSADEVGKKNRNAHEKDIRPARKRSPDDEEVRVNELSKIIEKSNEKLKKMKVSKDLAMDIAKQLKNKYDEIQSSKEALLGQLQKVEKDNEKLNTKIKDVEDSKMTLEMKMEGLKKDSKVRLQEEDAKKKKISEENAVLKARLHELEKKYKKELIESQKEIEEIQKERLSDIKKDFKLKENREEEIQRLTAEKVQLQSLLKDRQQKLETLEKKVAQLQDEVYRQKQHLKKKGERLEETNKELESIRKNSNDLEKQVKTLRKNIEGIDEMHKNLTKRTADHEHQIKAKEEEISELKTENLRLKTDLENERDTLLIKVKIVEDQQQTIMQLREKSEESKSLLKKNQSLERILNIEREEKLELQEALERLKWRKEELKTRVKNLEHDLLLAPQEVVKDLQKTQMVLYELENQVQIKEKEWELDLQSLIREKEQACSVAEFATKKLVQTTTEFQKQSEALKKLHRILAEVLAKKKASSHE